ncbi:peroxidase 70-like [Triticum dicoccoides]|uniref:peroxidase 70-like n=1 Tax=Triticum dicoccoides TaxID=85692 RepID=UPI0018904405|nr:peroxidase 70-like [Triticum dicoccoides]
MASSSLSVVLILCLAAAALAQLSTTFYDKSCPLALEKIQNSAATAVKNDRRMAASLLRMHFHDCFVQGCDASVLLNETSVGGNERGAFGKVGSLRGFEVIEQIKKDVEAGCKRPYSNNGPVVSCVDILAVAAREVTNNRACVGGPSWEVKLGRRDSTTASATQANQNLPVPFLGVAGLNASFVSKGFNLTDMVALSGAHTIGRAQCQNFRGRHYNESNINTTYATKLKLNCPQSGGNTNLAPLDDDTAVALNPDLFNNDYFINLQSEKGLLHSDQVLYNATAAGCATKDIIKSFASS